MSATDDTLVLESNPWIFGLAIIAMVVLFAGVGWVMLTSGEIIGGLMFTVGGTLMGVLSLWAFVRKTQLWLDRPSGQVALRSRSIFGFTEQTFPLADLTGAALQDSLRNKGQITHRPILRFGGQTDRIVPILDHYASGRGPGRIVITVNDWLARRP